MGVRGLHSYITDRGGFESITLTSLLQRHQKRARKIVVDGSSLTFFLLSCRINGQPIDLCHGGQFLHDLELIIWFDGINEEIKDETRLERELQRREAIATFVSAPPQLRTAKAAAGVPLLAASPYFDICEATAKQMNVRCYRAPFEADPAVAQSYFDENALCVLADDSDYLIFGVDYIPFKSLSWDSVSGEMNGQLFTAERTAQTLGITAELLPAFASLVGNDFVKSATLRTFHSFHTADVFDSHAIIDAMAQFLRDRDGQLRIEDLTFADENGREAGIDVFLESVSRYRLSSHSELAQKESSFMKRLDVFHLREAYSSLDISHDLAEVLASSRHIVTFPFIGFEDLQQKLILSFEPARSLAYAVICQLLSEEQRQNVWIEEVTIEGSGLVSTLVKPLQLPDGFPIIREQERKERLKIYVHAVADALANPKEGTKRVRSLQLVRKSIGPLEFQWTVCVIFATDLGAFDAIARAGVPVFALLKSFLVSLILLRDLRLQERVQLQPPDLFSLDCFMFLRVAQLAWKTAGLLLDAFGRPLDIPVVDMLDGRLFHSVCATVLAAENPDDALLKLLGPKKREYDILFKAVSRNCSFNFTESKNKSSVLPSVGEHRIMGHDGLWAQVSLNRPVPQHDTAEASSAFPALGDPLGIIADSNLNILKSKWTNLNFDTHLQPSLKLMEATVDAPVEVAKPQQKQNAWSGRGTVASDAQLKQLTDYVDQMEAAAGPRKPFKLEPFQEEAIKYMYQGQSILVCAPTGAGKTEIAMKAIEKVLRKPSGRVFFISPTKALVHQIYVEIALRFRSLNVKPALVGLITADFQIQTNARVILTVPELLRLFLHSPSENGLDDLSCVILDEFHLIQDETRGGEWERILLMLPPKVALVALSATLSKPSTFVSWANRRLLKFDNAQPLLLVQPESLERPIPLRILKFSSDFVCRSVNPVLLKKNLQLKHFTGEDLMLLQQALATTTASSFADSPLASSICAFCGMDFDSTTALLQHLNTSRHSAMPAPAELKFLEEASHTLATSSSFPKATVVNTPASAAPATDDRVNLPPVEAGSEELITGNAVLDELSRPNETVLLQALPLNDSVIVEDLELADSAAEVEQVVEKQVLHLPPETAADVILKAINQVPAGSLSVQFWKRVIDIFFQVPQSSWRLPIAAACHWAKAPIDLQFDYYRVVTALASGANRDAFVTTFVRNWLKGASPVEAVELFGRILHGTASDPDNWGIIILKELFNSPQLVQAISKSALWQGLKEQGLPEGCSSQLRTLLENFCKRFNSKVANRSEAASTPDQILNSYQSLHPRLQSRVKWQLEQRLQIPRRIPTANTVVTALQTDDLLPAIIFELARRSCEDSFQAISQVLVEPDADDFKALKAALDQYIALEQPAVVEMERRFHDQFLKGVGIHHSGFSKGWRTMVERMFRSKHLKCIVATATLAVGIHMPCKTVVFMSDSIHLDASNFHQMSGRAGRRGFDTEGNVLFVRFALPRIKYLVNKVATDLKPMQRLSLSATLELVDVAQQNAEQAAFALRNTLNVHVGGPEVTEQNMRMYKFGLVLLHKFGLVQHDGARLRPTLVGSAAARLSFYDPINVFMAALAPTEIFSRLVDSPKALLGWLAMLFTFQGPSAVSSSYTVPIPNDLIDLVNHMNAEIVWEAAQMIQQSRNNNAAASSSSSASRAVLTKFQPLPYSTVKGCSIKLLSLSQRFEPQADEADLTRTISMLGGPEGYDDIFGYSASDFGTLLHREFGKGWDALPLLQDQSPESTAALLFFFFECNPSDTDLDAFDDIPSWLLERTRKKFDFPGSELATLIKDFCKFVERIRVLLVAVEKSQRAAVDSQRMQRLNEACFALASKHMKKRAGPFYEKLADVKSLRSRASRA